MSFNKRKGARALQSLIRILPKIVYNRNGKIRWPAIGVVTGIVVLCVYLECNVSVTDAVVEAVVEEVTIEDTTTGGPQNSE